MEDIPWLLVFVEGPRRPRGLPPTSWGILQRRHTPYRARPGAGVGQRALARALAQQRCLLRLRCPAISSWQASLRPSSRPSSSRRLSLRPCYFSLLFRPNHTTNTPDGLTPRQRAATRRFQPSARLARGRSIGLSPGRSQRHCGTSAARRSPHEKSCPPDFSMTIRHRNG